MMVVLKNAFVQLSSKLHHPLLYGTLYFLGRMTDTMWLSWLRNVVPIFSKMSEARLSLRGKQLTDGWLMIKSILYLKWKSHFWKSCIYHLDSIPIFRRFADENGMIWTNVNFLILYVEMHQPLDDLHNSVIFHLHGTANHTCRRSA